MNQLPLISVVIPVYNVEKYIHECVESVLNQTYVNMEIILIDDGSPDRCPEICDRYAEKDNRIKVIHKKNGGLSDARNCGIKNATGEYLTFVDSDDVLSPDMIQYLYRLCIKYNTLLAQCNYIKEKAEFDLIIDGQEQGILVKKERCMIECISNISFCVSWGKLFHRTVLEGILFPVGKAHEDIYTTHLYFEIAGKIAFTTKRLYYYRQHNASLMAQSRRKPDLEELKADIAREHFFKIMDYEQAYNIQMQYIMKHIMHQFKTYGTYWSVKERKYLSREYRKRFVILLRMKRMKVSIDCWLFYFMSGRNLLNILHRRREDAR